MAHILLVEDDRSIVTNLTEFLQKKGFSITAVDGQRKALQILDESAAEFDLVLLDVSLADGNGFAICRAAKSSTELPVIFLTASGDEYSVVTGLDLGADDYLVKPSAFEELMARIRCVSRRPHALAVDDSFTVGDITWQAAESILTGPAGHCTLSKKEAALLEIFLHSKGQTLPRSMILMKVWGPDSNVEEGNLDNYIHFLRRRLQNTGSSLQIKTVRGIGYTLQ